MPDLAKISADVHSRWMDAMRRGDFEQAWRQTDRLEIPRRREGILPRKEWNLSWDGTPIKGQDVLIRSLHGLGDAVQFARYLPEVRRIAASVMTLVQPALLRLFQTTPELGEVRNGWNCPEPPFHNVEIEIMELAYVFRSGAATIPRAVPYFNCAEIQSLSQVRIARSAKPFLRVGLIWSSSAWDRSRSIPLALFADLAEVKGVELFSLQQDFAEHVPLPERVHPLHEQTTDILDAASAMIQLDLIISVDTFAAHLAGALGRPVWLLLKDEADWRWQREGTLSPWYPTMRIYRQPKPGDWTSVARALKNDLIAWQTEELPRR